MDKRSFKKVIVKPHGKDRFEVVQDSKFYLKSANGVIPKGFISDGASIPRIFWSIYPPFKSEYFSACILHDYLCLGAKSKADYRLADEVLKEALEFLGLSKFKVFIFFHACNAFHGIKCFLKGI